MKIPIIAFMLYCALSLQSFSGDGQKDPIYLHYLPYGIGDSNKFLKNITIKIVLGEDFDVRIDGNDGIKYAIAGRIERRDGTLYAHLHSQYASTDCNTDGIIETEKIYPVGNKGCGFQSIIFLSSFVVSINADSKPFLQFDPQKQGNMLSK
jgi:hypothetical protein